jgi:hypothetical protein
MVGMLRDSPPRRNVMGMRRFSPSDATAIDGIKYFYIRAGDDHRFIGIWVVVVDGRVFVRPWNDKAGGWYRAFLANPRGAIRIGDREVPVRALRVRSAKLSDAVDAAYAEKYTTKPNQKYVKGFATAKRRATIMELVPL